MLLNTPLTPNIVVWIKITRIRSAVSACISGVNPWPGIDEPGTKITRVIHGAKMAPTAEMAANTNKTKVIMLLASRAL